MPWAKNPGSGLRRIRTVWDRFSLIGMDFSGLGRYGNDWDYFRGLQAIHRVMKKSRSDDSLVEGKYRWGTVT